MAVGPLPLTTSSCACRAYRCFAFLHPRGVVAALVGIVFGLPSLRHQGFSISRRDPRAQFLRRRALTKFGWFSNYSSSGVITAQEARRLGFAVDTPVKRYLLVLAIVSVMALAARTWCEAPIGRPGWAVRDMDVAAEVVGIPMMKTKLLAFAISSFYCGVAGALYAFAYWARSSPAGFAALFPSGSSHHHRRRRSAAYWARSWRAAPSRAPADLHGPFGDFDRGALRPRLPAGLVSNLTLMPLRRAHHFFPRGRTAGPGAPVADRQGKAEALALPH